MEARWGGKVEITKKTNNADQVTALNIDKDEMIKYDTSVGERKKGEFPIGNPIGVPDRIRTPRYRPGALANSTRTSISVPFTRDIRLSAF